MSDIPADPDEKATEIGNDGMPEATPEWATEVVHALTADPSEDASVMDFLTYDQAVIQEAVKSGISTSDARRALDEAEEQDLIIRHYGEIAPADVDHLLAVIEAEGEAENKRRHVIARCSVEIRKLRARDTQSASHGGVADD